MVDLQAHGRFLRDYGSCRDPYCSLRSQWGPLDCSAHLHMEGPRPKNGRGPSMCGAAGNRTRVL